MGLAVLERSKGTRLKIFLICLAGLLVGCSSPEEQLAVNKPFIIAQTNGVTVWKVADKTPGGASAVYFTTPAGSTVWDTGGNSPSYYQVSGLSYNGKPVYLEKDNVYSH